MYKYINISYFIEKTNYYHMWQEEIKAMKQLEQLVDNMQKHIVEIDEKIRMLRPPESLTIMEVSFHTDEEELERQTDWILKKKQ